MMAGLTTRLQFSVSVQFTTTSPTSPGSFFPPSPVVFRFQKKEILLSSLEGFLRAKDEVRTRDLNLGKVALYQLSYFRLLFVDANIG